MTVEVAAIAQNQYVVDMLRRSGIGTLLFDLPTNREDAAYENRFDIGMLTARLASATTWVTEQRQAAGQS